jgi:hypothetical protein
MLTLFGVAALTFMMLMYALERRGPRFILAFAAGCGLASLYGFLSGAWPFGVVEAIWAGVAVQRFRGVSGARREAIRAHPEPPPIPSDPRSTLTGPRPPGGQL